MTVTPLDSLKRRLRSGHDDVSLPAPVLAMLRQGQPVLLAARSSSRGGGAARQAAITGAYSAARKLADRGLDLQRLMPTPDELGVLVKAGHRRREALTHDGRPLTHYFYLYDKAADQGLVVLVQWGSGTLLDDSDRQPALEILGHQIRLWRPALVYGTESRAWGRNGFGMGALVNAMQAVERDLGTPPYIGHIDMEPVPGTADETAAELFKQGHEGRKEARGTRDRTVRAAITHAARGQVDGPWTYPSAAVPPPPLATARLRGTSGRPGKQIAFLDTPLARPDEATVLYGLPQARTLDGLPADQLANTRWFYEHAFTPGFGLMETAAHLVSHGHATQALRRQRHDDGAVFTLRAGRLGHRDAWNVFESIWEHREFHTTGEFHQAFSDGTRIPVVVRTPDGEPMARPHQVERIERALEQLSSVRKRPRTFLLSGQPLLVDGERAKLTPRVAGDGSVAYVYERDNPRRPSQRHHAGVPIPHEVLTGAVLEGLAAAGSGRLLPALVRRDDAALKVEADRLAEQVATQQSHLEAVTARYKAELSRTASEARLKAAGEALEEADSQLRELKAALMSAEDRLRDAPGAGTGVPLAQLFPLAASMRDALDDTYRATLRHAIDDFTVTTQRETVMRDTRRQLVRFDFDLRLVDDDGAVWRIPVSGEHVTGSSQDTNARLALMIEAMRNGVPAADAMPSRHWQPWLRAALGFPTRARPAVMAVRDPRILRLTMALLHPPVDSPVPVFDGDRPEDVPTLVGGPLTERQRTRAATRLDEPASLLHRLAGLHTQPLAPGHRWLLDGRHQIASLMTAAGSKRGLDPRDVPSRRRPLLRDATEVVQGRLRPTACPACGSRRRSFSRLREVAGLLCLACRRDDLGHAWPADPYDRYLDR
ncbi:MAG: hypothetical protein AB7I24_16315 [Candidatus Nanopelagicales bacterium]